MPSTAGRGRGAPLITAGLPAIYASLHRAGMRFETFSARQSRDRGGQTTQSAFAELLDRNHFEVVRHGEPSAQASRAAGGKHVIRTGSVIPRGFRTIIAHARAAAVG